MVVTERTSLTRPTDPPTYVEFAGILVNRRRKIRHLQCCFGAFLVAIIIMSLVATVSYSLNKVEEPSMEDLENAGEVVTPPSLTAVWMPRERALQMSLESNRSGLTSSEWLAAVQAGREAIDSRMTADSLSTPLPAPSPDSRHQYAVKTSLQAGQLALGGIGELAATRYVEKSRVKLGMPSSMGSYFPNVWVPNDTCKEFSTFPCPSRKYRSFDGTCNNPANLGAALTPFIRNLPADYADGIETPRTGKNGKQLPSAREISLKVHPPAPSSNPAFTVMLAVFGQFLDHDITATAISQGTNGISLSCCPAAPNAHPECFPVSVGPGDPVFDLAARDCMEFVRSAPAPQCKIGPREQLNQVTAFIDGSVIYGPDLRTANDLRTGQGGLLRMFITPDNRTLLPQSTNPNDGCNRDTESTRGRYCFASGDGRANENLHLTTMHLLWARQHNRVAGQLSQMNPTWNDETVFQETRRIVGAQLQHITYKELIPLVLGDTVTDDRKLRPLSSGFRSRNASAQVNPAIANSFAAAAFRFAHTLLPGLMKVTDSQRGTFSYVELHRMLFNPYSLYSKGGLETSLTTATSNLIQKTTTHVTSQLTNHLFEDPLSNSTVPCGLDLVSLNIQRGRDHGLPGYTSWRNFCGLGKAETFEELRDHMDVEAFNEISKLYADVDDIDLYTGALAENYDADGLIGPTFKCLIGDQFSRIQQGDRFWYETPDEPQSFTEAQLHEIRKTSLSKIICDCSDEIYQIQPEVMRSASAKNPMVSCEDLPGVDFSAWKDVSASILKASAITEKPKVWQDFEAEINATVKELVDSFGNATVRGKLDWITFRDWLNKSFTDLRDDISAVNSTIVKAAGKSSSQLKPTYVETGKSTESPKFEKSAISKAPSTMYATYEDWIRLRNEITKNLNNALANATGVPSPEQRSDLLANISSEIAVIKAMIASVKAERLLNESAIIEDAEINSALFKLKEDLSKALTDAINRIQTEAPSPGDPAWTTYGLEIRKEFASIASKARVLFDESVASKSPSATTDSGKFSSTLEKSVAQKVANPTIDFWGDFASSMNKSVNTAGAKLAKKPLLPNGPALTTSTKMIMNTFTKFRNASIESKKNDVVLSSKPTEDPAITKFWDDFRNGLNESIKNAYSDIAAKSPPPGDPAWATFGPNIMNTFATFKDKFAGLDTPIKTTEKRIPISQNDVPFDWITFKTDIIHSVVDTLNTTIKSMPLVSKITWTQMREKIMSEYETIPSKVTPQTSLTTDRTKNLGNPPEGQPFDWFTFKNEIIQSISEIINKTIPSRPSVTVPKVTNLQEESDIRNAATLVGKPKIDPKLPKIDPKIPKLDELQFSSLIKDWTEFRSEINASLIRALSTIKTNAPSSPNDPAWVAFRDSIKDEFAALKKVVDTLKSNDSSILTTLTKQAVLSLAAEKTKMQKARGGKDYSDLASNSMAQVQQANESFEKLGKRQDVSLKGKLATPAPLIPASDWIAFKQEVKATVARFVSAINTTDADEWKQTNALIKKSFASLRDEILSAKNHTAALQ